MEQALVIATSLGVLIILLLIILVKLQLNKQRDLLMQLIMAAGQLEKVQNNTLQAVHREIAHNREEMSLSNRQAREELGRVIKSFETSLMARMTEIANLQKNQLDTFSNQLTSLTLSNEQKLEQMRETLETRVKELQHNNAQKLDQMRIVVDEKLHATLEQRLGESFKLVSERLELVHKGLGEMQVLATGVGDLKKVLSNVKTRGTWGEVQLGNILEDILAPDQYAANVAVKKGAERVEFAIKLPGSEHERDCLWLPIDAKFPLEDYHRLLEAYENGEPQIVEHAGKQLELRIKTQARYIHNKYIEPPATTDFAIMFLPTEGLYAEVLRRPGLFETLRREYRVSVAGPTTLAALVNSLSVGFRTLAIQKRSSEVWSVLGAVKTEFSKFGMVLEKTQKKLQEASNTIDEATRRSRMMEKKLKTVEALPDMQAHALLGEEDYSDEIAAEAEK